MRKLHLLSEINEKDKTANCKACGFVKITVRDTKPVIRYKCNTANNKRCNEYKKRKLVETKIAKGEQLIYINGKLRRPKGVYRIILENKKTYCERCGFVALHPIQLDVHHKNHTHSDNTPSNLETLCSNCHRLHHQLNRKRGV